MSRFIEYSNNILFFDVMFGETLNEETRCSKCVHPFLRMQYTMRVCRNTRCTFIFVHYYTNRFIFFMLR